MFQPATLKCAYKKDTMYAVVQSIQPTLKPAFWDSSRKRSVEMCRKLVASQCRIYPLFFQLLSCCLFVKGVHRNSIFTKRCHWKAGMLLVSSEYRGGVEG